MKRVNRPFKANKRCLTCFKELDGRLGKFYCDELCRSKYHNRKKSADERCVRAINKILLKNREALEDIAAGNKSKLKKDMLVERGFNFAYFTHKKEVNRKTFIFCYEWGYSMNAFEEVEVYQLDENSFLASM